MPDRQRSQCIDSRNLDGSWLIDVRMRERESLKAWELVANDRHLFRRQSGILAMQTQGYEPGVVTQFMEPRGNGFDPQRLGFRRWRGLGTASRYQCNETKTEYEHRPLTRNQRASHRGHRGATFIRFHSTTTVSSFSLSSRAQVQRSITF